MINNDILRRLRYTFSFPDKKLVDLFELGGLKVEINQMDSWMKKEEEDGFIYIKIIFVFIYSKIFNKKI